jgi:hypothetical protein
VHLALAVRGLAAGQLVQGTPRQLLVEPTQFLERLIPGAAECHDLGTVHQAETFVGHHFGLMLAPSRQGDRPLPDPPKLVDTAAECDRVAVHNPRDDRRQLARRDRHHRLVD